MCPKIWRCSSQGSCAQAQDVRLVRRYPAEGRIIRQCHVCKVKISRKRDLRRHPAHKHGIQDQNKKPEVKADYQVKNKTPVNEDDPLGLVRKERRPTVELDSDKEEETPKHYFDWISASVRKRRSRIGKLVLKSGNSQCDVCFCRSVSFFNYIFWILFFQLHFLDVHQLRRGVLRTPPYFMFSIFDRVNAGFPPVVF